MTMRDIPADDIEVDFGAERYCFDPLWFARGGTGTAVMSDPENAD